MCLVIASILSRKKAEKLKGTQESRRNLSGLTEEVVQVWNNRCGSAGGCLLQTRLCPGASRWARCPWKPLGALCQYFHGNLSVWMYKHNRTCVKLGAKNLTFSRKTFVPPSPWQKHNVTLNLTPQNQNSSFSIENTYAEEYGNTVAW